MAGTFDEGPAADYRSYQEDRYFAPVLVRVDKAVPVRLLSEAGDMAAKLDRDGLSHVVEVKGQHIFVRVVDFSRTQSDPSGTETHPWMEAHFPLEGLTGVYSFNPLTECLKNFHMAMSGANSDAKPS